MKRKIIALPAAVLMLLTGCQKNVPDISETISPETYTENITETVISFPEKEETVSISFAKAETTLPEETAEPEFTDPENFLADNQLECSTVDLYILMEFTGAEELAYYPRALRLSYYRDDYYVLHANFQVTNISDESLDFIPQKMILLSSNKNSGGSMIPISARDRGLIASDTYYTIEPGDTASFSVDFVGNEICLEYPYELTYNIDGFREPNNIDAKKLNNVSAGEFSYLARSKIKNAIRAARDIREKTTPEKLDPKDGEYSVNTPKNSCCFTVDALEGGNYIRVALRLRCLTGKPEKFDPYRFSLHLKGQQTTIPAAWDIDTLLVGDIPDISDMKIEGVTETLYKAPFDLSVRADGTAEYTMYFYSMNYDPKDCYMFSYDGENDVFECVINID